jgi:hypothetical protein
MCTCKENNWVRLWQETGDGKYPASEHAPGCEQFKQEEFIRLTLDGTTCIMEPREAEAMLEEDKSPYLKSSILLTRDQFEKLGDFAGF